MKIGIIGAMDIEIEDLRQHMENVVTKTISKVHYHEGTLEGIDVVAAVCGIGKVNAAVCTQSMILTYSPDMIINTGVAGGLDSNIVMGDIVISTEVVQYDYKIFDAPSGFIQELDMIKIPASKELIDKFLHAAKKLKHIKIIPGIIASGDQFIEDSDKSAKIRSIFNASAVEMEGASIGHTCCLNDIPFCVVRSISDNANEDSPMEFWEFAKIAAKNSILLMLEFLKII